MESDKPSGRNHLCPNNAFFNLTLLVEKLDEILERIDNEDIGFVITENGLPDMVLIPFRWFAENFPDEVPDDLRSADYKSG